MIGLLVQETTINTRVFSCTRDIASISKFADKTLKRLWLKMHTSILVSIGLFECFKGN